MKQLKRKITKAELEALPEVVREYYTESGDSFVLAAEDAVAAQNAAKLEREAREKAERELAQANADLAGLADRRDIDPKRYKELVDAAAAAEQQKAIDAKDFEEAKRLAVEAATKPLRDQITQLTGQVTTLTSERDDEVAFSSSAVIGDRLNAFVGSKVHPHLQKAFASMLREDYKPNVKRNGKDRELVWTVDGKEVKWDDFMGQVEKADWAKGFLLSETNGNGGGGSGAAGGGVGATGAPGGGGAKKTVKASEMGQHLDAIAKGEVEVVEG